MKHLLKVEGGAAELQSRQELRLLRGVCEEFLDSLLGVGAARELRLQPFHRLLRTHWALLPPGTKHWTKLGVASRAK